MFAELVYCVCLHADTSVKVLVSRKSGPDRSERQPRTTPLPSILKNVVLVMNCVVGRKPKKSTAPSSVPVSPHRAKPVQPQFAPAYSMRALAISLSGGGGAPL